MNITFIGNCQMLSLCYYFQQLLKSEKYNICWVLYDDEFKKHLGQWSNKCKNKILNYDETIKRIKISDIIIYQNMVTYKSLFSNTNKLEKIINSTCKLIRVPSIYFNYDNYENSMKELSWRENMNNVHIKVSDMFDKFKDKKLMLNIWHPKTFLFMEIIKELCILLKIDFFTNQQYNNFLKNDNFMQLP